MEHKDTFILEDIIEYCDRIINVSSAINDDEAAFLSDLNSQDVCAFRILQIGELVNSLSIPTKR